MNYLKKMEYKSPAFYRGLFSIATIRFLRYGILCVIFLLSISDLNAWVDPPKKVEEKEIGSGLVYSVFKHDLTGNIYFIRLKAKSDSFRLTPSVNPNGITRCANVKEHALNIDSDALISVNASYFDPARYPIGTVVIDGEIVSLDSHSRTSLGIKSDRTTIIGQVNPRAFVSADDYFEPIWIWGYNHPSKSDSIVAYNRFFGKDSLNVPSDGKALMIKGRKISGIAASGSVSIADNDLVLIFRGKSCKHAERFAVGEDVTYGVVVPDEWAGITSMISGGPRLIEDGKVLDISINPEKFESRIFQKHTRTITGRTWNDEIFFAVFPSSVSLDDASNVLLEMNVVDAMGLDGGSSSSFWVNGIKAFNTGKDVPVALVIEPFDKSKTYASIPYFENKYWK